MLVRGCRPLRLGRIGCDRLGDAHGPRHDADEPNANTSVSTVRPCPLGTPAIRLVPDPGLGLTVATAAGFVVEVCVKVDVAHRGLLALRTRSVGTLVAVSIKWPTAGLSIEVADLLSTSDVQDRRHLLGIDRAQATTGILGRFGDDFYSAPSCLLVQLEHDRQLARSTHPDDQARRPGIPSSSEP